MSLKKFHLGVCTVGSLLVPRIVSACPVCFGASDSPILQGSNMGILALLLVTLAVLGAFGMFFRSLAQRAQGAIETNGTRPPAPAAAVSREGATR
jgi:hypothetical protein